MPASSIFKFVSRSEADTRKFGERLGKILKPGTLLALEGDLGSGKTAFVRGLARGLGVRRAQDIASPTFAIVQEHQGRLPLCHADLYRLAPGELRETGLEEYWRTPEWVVAVEWADRAAGFLPEQGSGEFLRLRFQTISEKERKISLYGKASWKRNLRRIAS